MGPLIIRETKKFSVACYILPGHIPKRYTNHRKIEKANTQGIILISSDFNIKDEGDRNLLRHELVHYIRAKKRNFNVQTSYILKIIEDIVAYREQIKNFKWSKIKKIRMIFRGVKGSLKMGKLMEQGLNPKNKIKKEGSDTLFSIHDLISFVHAFKAQLLFANALHPVFRRHPQNHATYKHYSRSIRHKITYYHLLNTTLLH
jgi:hypothetical protein